MLWKKGTLTCTTHSRLLTTLRKKSFANIVEKGENAGNQHFLLFPQCFFYPSKIKFQVLIHTFELSSANAFNLDRFKILSFGKELMNLRVVLHKACNNIIRDL